MKKRVFFKYLILILISAVINGCSERKVIITPAWKKFKKAKITKTEIKKQNWASKINYDLSNFETDKSLKSYGDPKAKKGGSLSMAIYEFPPTYRTVGKDTRLMILSLMEGLIYETLLSLDPETLEYHSGLASHWQISDDKKIYRFAINSKARWSDGYPVTAHDVVATYKLLTDSGIKDPAISGLFKENFEIPKAINKQIVEVKCKKENWRSFMYFSGLTILPAHHIDKVDGETFLQKYQYQMMPGSGPYKLDLNKTIKGRKLVLNRSKSFWGEALEQNKGMFNFDQIIFKVINDDRLQLEKFKKGEFDLYIPPRAQWWKEELNSEKVEAIKRGLVEKKKIFNFKPLGMSGLAFNTQTEPFKDIRVRKAFSMLWNVEQLIDKLFFKEYVQCRSYFQGTVYENLKNLEVKYNVEGAFNLLKEAGWEKNQNDGWLYKDGNKFEIDFRIESSLNKIFTPFQQDLKKVGINLNLINMTSQSIFEKIMKKNFNIAYIGWTGLLFPNPESSMHSKYANLPETNNIAGISLKRVDEICELYDKSYSIKERIALLRELDGIVTSNYYYAMGWVAPYASRICYWNKFGYPEKVLTYSGDWRSIPALWWEDSLKADKIKKAMNDKSIHMEKTKDIVDIRSR